MVGATTSNFNALSGELSNISEKGSYLADILADGWRIFPLHRIVTINDKSACPCHGQKGCKGPGKHPMWKWGSPMEVDDPKTLPTIIKRLRFDHAAGWGLHPGLSGLAILDIDTKNDGLARWETLQAELGLQHLVPYTRTGSGGLHYYFRAPENCDERRGWASPEGFTSTQVKFEGVGEFLSGQHYVVLPHSIHESGRLYELTGGPIYEEIPSALVDEINRRLHEGKKKAAAAAANRPTTTTKRDPLTGEARALAYIMTMPDSIMGQGGSDRYFAVACALVLGFDLSPDQALPIILQWNDAKSFPAWSTDESIHKLSSADERGGARGYLLNSPISPYIPSDLADVYATSVPFDFKTHGYTVTGEMKIVDAWVKAFPAVDPVDLDWLREWAATPAPKIDIVSSPAEPTPGIPCPRPRTINLRSLDGERGGQIVVGCRQQGCPECSKGHIRQQKETVSYWFLKRSTETGEYLTPTLYLSRPDEAKWETVRRRCSRISSEYTSVSRTGHDAEADYRAVLITSAPTLVEGCRAVTPEEAVEILHREIDSTPLHCRANSYRHSKGWDLLANQNKKAKKWLVQFENDNPEGTTEKILDAHKIYERNKFSGGRFHGYGGFTWAWDRKDKNHIDNEIFHGWMFDKDKGPYYSEDPDKDFSTPAPAAPSSYKIEFSFVSPSA